MYNFLVNSSNRKNSFLILFVLAITQITNINAQNISVSGRITSSRYPVVDVSVMFIDNSDTTLQYSAITDNKGQYKIDLITSIETTNNSVPTKFQLGQSYPNPFSASTAIPYGLKEETNVQVVIYDVLGRSVKKFDVGHKSIGTHNLFWDGRNNFGKKVANGIYFYKFIINGESQVRKLIFNHNGNNGLALPGSFSFGENNPLSKENDLKNLEGTNFTIRLRNTNSTTPYLIEEDIENVVIQNDTTINFNVSTKSIASINYDSTHQIIRGLGASNIVLWRPDMTDNEIETAFGSGDGQLGFTILRIMIEPNSSRWVANLATAKKAYEMGATIIASPWHSPSELSENVGSINRVRYDMYEEYAAHLDSFSTYMANNGVPIYGISIQNEPDIEGNWTSWTTEEMFTFMKDYAHLIEGSKVMAPESFHFDRTYADPILNDSSAAANADIICGHIYGSGNSKYALAKEKGKEVWMTEYLINSDGNGDNMDTSYAAAMEVAKSISGSMNADMSAYVWWYLVRYYGPINDETGFDPRLRKGAITKKGYVMSQFARFVRPGYYRVDSKVTRTTSSIKVTAYKDPESSKMVFIVVNTAPSEIEQNFRAQNMGITTFIPYTTSKNKNCEQGTEIIVDSDNFKINLEPESITTFVSQ